MLSEAVFGRAEELQRGRDVADEQIAESQVVRGLGAGTR
jgi:hypothetical protein